MRLWQKFCDSHVKFARNSYEIRANFVRISHFQNIHTFLSKGKVKKVTVTDPTSAPANPEV